MVTSDTPDRAQHFENFMNMSVLKSQVLSIRLFLDITHQGVILDKHCWLKSKRPEYYYLPFWNLCPSWFLGMSLLCAIIVWVILFSLWLGRAGKICINRVCNICHNLRNSFYSFMNSIKYNGIFVRFNKTVQMDLAANVFLAINMWNNYNNSFCCIRFPGFISEQY